MGPDLSVCVWVPCVSLFLSLSLSLSLCVCVCGWVGEWLGRGVHMYGWVYELVVESWEVTACACV